jgi:amino acid adenylation domain-containing protein
VLADLPLERSARLFPDKLALVCRDRRLTYRQLDQAANRFAAGLLAHGVVRGDAVVLLLENSADAVIAIFGTLRAGALIVPLGSTVKSDKLAYVLEDSTAKALVADQRLQSVVEDALRRLPPLRVVILVGDGPAKAGTVPFQEMVSEDRSPERPQPPGIDLDLAALIYTSGSTGRPKGVTLTHGNIVAAATSIDDYLQNTPDDVILDVLPLSFDYGLYQLFLAFQAGAKLVLEPSFVYQAVVLDLLEREKVTALPLVPTLAALLARHDLRPFEGSLRYITSTGAVFQEAHISALRAQLPRVRIFSMYGLTECKRVSFLPPEDLDRRPGSVGKPMENVEVFVRSEDGTLSATGEGELVVRGANVMVGYWRAPAETQRVLFPGPIPGQSLLRTGDRFRIDDEGYMYFLGRMDDQIKSRGQRVSPQEVERTIYGIPGVSGVAVVGSPDPVLGMAVKAFVSLAPGSVVTEKDVLHHCSLHLEDFMVPRSVELAAQLPRTESGKIDRRTLHLREIERVTVSE